MLLRSFSLAALVAALSLPLARPLPADEAPSLRPRLYAHLGLGVRSISSEDADRFFDLSSVGFPKPTMGPQIDPLVDLGLGYQASPWLAVELALGVGPLRAFSANYTSGSTNLFTLETQWYAYTATVMPAFRFWRPGLFRKPFYQTLGLRLGGAWLDGTVSLGGAVNGMTGQYSQSSSAFTYGAVYRIEQMLGQRLDLGLELAWDHAAFTSISDSNGSGVFYNMRGIEKDNAGHDLALDFSGPSLKVVLAFWFGSPLAPPAKDGSTPIGDSPSEHSRLLGESLMKNRRYAQAEAWYREAVRLDANNAAAWKGLGAACYYQGKKQEAVQAYRWALSLNPHDSALAAFLRHYQAQP